MDDPRLEILWGQLLSRKPELVRAAFARLTAEEKVVVLTHLKRMAEESGWQEAQRQSAQAALSALQEI